MTSMEELLLWQAVACLLIYLYRYDLLFRTCRVLFSCFHICGWDDGEEFFAKMGLDIFLNHPEHFYSTPDDPRFEDLRAFREEDN